ncbi:acyltransferase family protein [Microbacterium trichothecenolyticum]|uniref:O-acetyltransferase OatA n=1 Tax=Microbacterium trichothecenolyticum TaxID=69370 RepID=A0A0M2H4J5_MICTR|nr:acyltransferase family protein [Microbacterium trichothecenolyticum]KJL41228.1 O-acetyltransferase OatA [Microbacterium trichothecenolyticum]
MTAPTSLSTAQSRRPDRTQRFRPDIQALRALAIGLVVVNHLWPTRLTGGYVGVDVFFVISGFLITGHLFGEFTSNGRIRLGRFYARRIRRLLPAAVLVLAVSGILVAVFLPYPQWERNAAELGASVLYVENWLLAGLSVNYSALNDAASVAQHYWSLSVEEQFYLAWPLVLLGGIWLLARLRGDWRGPRARAVSVLGVVGVLSFAASVIFTMTAPQQAYFATFTRAWEFAVGGLIALAAPRLMPGRFGAATLSAGGFAAIALAAVWFGPSTPFPGSAALLPVLGTAAIIVAGTRPGPTWHSPVTSSVPVQWVGNISYSLYLWHWPLIVIAPFALRAELTTVAKIGVLACAVALAALTKRLVEDPGIKAPVWASSVRRSLVGMGAGMLVVLVVAGGLWAGSTVRTAADSQFGPLPTGPCAGPAALEHVASCPDAFGPPETTVMSARNSPFMSPEECTAAPDMTFGGRTTTRVCDFSDHRDGASDVWVVGDSHAEQWQGAIFEIARAQGWRVTISLFGGCPAADVAFVGFRTPAGQAEVSDCRAWSREVSRRIADDRPALVVTSMASRLQLVEDGSGRPPVDQFVDGLARDWQRWTDAGTRVVAIADPPLNGEVRSPDCVALNPTNPVDCARPRAQAQPADPLVLAGERFDSSDVMVADFTSSFCDDALCYAVVGGEPVYYDADHLNLRYVRMLAPQLERIVTEELAVAEG